MGFKKSFTKIRSLEHPFGKLFVRSAMICGLFLVIGFGLSLRKIDPLPLSQKPLQFNAQKAFDQMAALSKGFPNRVTWGENRHRAAQWLKNEFVKMGYVPKAMQFSEVVDGRQYNDLENIYVEKRGTKYPNEIVVAMAHYDIVDTTVEGAMDDGSGVGVVMELARIFAAAPTDRTVLFLITDSEEYGAFWGARAFARSFDRADQIVAAASFDFVAPETQTDILTLCDGLKTGYTPLWLREMALNSIRSLGEVKAADLSNVVEHMERAIQIPASDHGAFLQAGIPAFNWVGQTSNFPYVMAHYHHTPYDTVEAMKPQSLGQFGRAAERLIYSIDELPRLPTAYKNGSYWKISQHLYIDGWAATLLHILAFIPFLLYSASKFSTFFSRRLRGQFMPVFQNEAKNVGILLGSLLLGYAILRLLPALKIITQYETFPATQKSLILYTPDFLAILLVVGSIMGIYWLFKRTFAEPLDSQDSAEIRHSFHAAFLAIIIFLAFLKNSYLATLLLLPPAYLWTLIRARGHERHRILNALLVLGGAITFVTVTIILTTIFHIGVIYWYLFLSAAYGLISAYTVVLFFMALAIMIRLVRAFVL